MTLKWREGETLGSLAKLVGTTADRIRKMNDLSIGRAMYGQEIKLPSYEATYNVEASDDLDQIGRLFGYNDSKGLLKVNGFSNAEFDGSKALNLPDWHFCYARETDTLGYLDELFDLPKGSVTIVGRVFHANKRIPYPSETIAVPSRSFANTLEKHRG